MLFQYSEILFYHSSDNDKHMQTGQNSKQGFAYSWYIVVKHF